MKQAPESYLIGIDFGSDSVRSILVSACGGREIASAVAAYPRWRAGRYCDPAQNRYRQHPLDYLESLRECVRHMLEECDKDVVGRIVGLSFDTTASTPALTDEHGTPLALLPEFAENPDAMFVLWKDHTALEEADLINDLAKRWEVDYTRFSGGIYSCEWVWAKMLHCLRNTPSLQGRARSWVEHCDWVGAVLTGDTTPGKIARGRCVAGHKAMWHEAWGGLPSWDFLKAVDPLLEVFRGNLYRQTVTGGVRIGGLCPEWADAFGLRPGIAVGMGAVDCHVGAVGAGIKPGTLVKVMGTSTCDIAVASCDELGDRAVRGICGQVDGSVLPGYIGLEAGQAAFGDIYAWFRRLMSWPLRHIATSDPRLEERILGELTAQAERLALTPDDPVALDWLNGRRTPDADPRVQGVISGLTLAASAPALYKALVESTAFGSRAINERMLEEGVPIDTVIAIGGIARKSPFVMQTMADVLGVPIRVLASDQACALGAAMFAAVAADVYPSVADAQQAMSPGFSDEYRPDLKRHAVYDTLYARYLKLGRGDR